MGATVSPIKSGLGEYLRVDEIAHRFDVSIDDVLAACSLLGFDAHDASSLIELELFTRAVKTVPVRAQARHATPFLKQRRLIVLSSGAVAAALIAVVGAFVIPSSGTPSQPSDERAVLAAAYRDALTSTYEATVAEVPQATDYRALAQQWAAIEPPPELAAEHAALVAEAETVAELADAAPEEVAESLRDHLTELENQRLAP